MKQVIEMYKDRLVNLSNTNRSLITKKLIAQRAFDLTSIRIDTEMDLDKLIKFLAKRDEDPFMFIKEESVYVSENIESFNKKFFKKGNSIEKIEATGKELPSLSKNIRVLMREISSIAKETGRYELNVGYPFVEGNFNDGTFVKAPLLLFPVTCIKTQEGWMLENITDSPILINRVFLLAYSKFCDVPIPDIEDEYISIKHFRRENKDIIVSILKFLKNAGIQIKYNEKDKEYKRFDNYTNENTPTYRNGELVIQKHIILGQFPISNSIYKDYMSLESSSISNKPLISLLDTNYKDNSKPATAPKFREYKLVHKESDLNLITELDYSQECAIKKVNDSDQLVIYGPPGTGKSQTIVNIIGDSLSRGKKILMVSQKRAALDVIYNRLGELNSKAVMIHDAKINKKEFYYKVTESINNIAINEVTSVDNILECSKNIDERIKLLDELGYELHKERDFGLSIQQMYAKSNPIRSKDDIRYSGYKKFRDHEHLAQYKYTDLLKLNKTFEDTVIDAYRVFHLLKLKNKNIQYVYPNLNFMKMDEFKENIPKIDEQIDYLKNIQKEDKEMFHDILSSLKTKRHDELTEHAINRVAERIVIRRSKELTDTEKRTNWYKPKTWIKHSNRKTAKILDAKRAEQIELVTDMYNRILVHYQTILKIKKVINNKGYYKIISKLIRQDDIHYELTQIYDSFEMIEPNRKELKLIFDLHDVVRDALDFAYEEDVEKMLVNISQISDLAILYHLNKLENDTKIANRLDLTAKYDRLVSFINNELNDKRNHCKTNIKYIWDNKSSSTLETENFKNFKHQGRKETNQLPIRTFLSEYFDYVSDMFPIFLLSPETVSEVLPLVDGLFDVVIFDEASQMFVENAIPTVYRGKKVIIAGDDKQLKPSAFFRTAVSSDYEEENINKGTAAALEEESLLDLAKVNYDDISLKYHYRSLYDELISFSNYAFYNRNLQVAPNITTQSYLGSPIERIKVQGKWHNNSNQEEANRIVDLVDEILNKKQENETIGIITFNSTQQDLILSKLEQRKKKDETFKNLYLKEEDRVENGENLSLFVKNIENVQGDERDIIIFSIGYAPNEEGKVNTHFGPLSLEGGENRLNVAISRSKKKVYVVTSIEPEDLKVQKAKNLGPQLFKKYLEYVREESVGNKANSQRILDSLSDLNPITISNNSTDTTFEDNIYNDLTNKGYEVHRNIGVSGYKLDIAIYDKENSKYLIGIECDQSPYKTSYSSRERDVHRKKFLESRGWNLRRIWSRDYWNNPEKEIQDIIDSI